MWSTMKVHSCDLCITTIIFRTIKETRLIVLERQIHDVNCLKNITNYSPHCWRAAKGAASPSVLLLYLLAKEAFGKEDDMAVVR